MKEEKHSDQIFRKKLENYSVDPPAHIWTGIQDQLLKDKRKSRVVFVRWISAAAAIVLAFLGGWYLSRDTNLTQPILTEKSVVQEEENIANEDFVPESQIIISETKDQEFVASTREIEQTKTETEKQSVASLKPEEQAYVASSEIKPRESFIFKLLESRKPQFNSSQKIEVRLAKSKQVSIAIDDLTDADRALMAQNAANRQPDQKEESIWKLGMMLSPGYSSQVTSHSKDYANNMTYSASEGNANVTGGISVQVKTGKRLSVESGVYYDKNGQKSEQSLQLFSMASKRDEMYASPSTDQFSNSVEIKDGSIVMNSNAGIIALNTLPPGTEITSNMESLDAKASNAIVTSGDLAQVFDFIQVPLYLRYKVVDSRFDIEMIGGFNAGVLVGNNAYIDNSYGLQNIGKTENINALSISGTLGVGLNYKLGKHFSLGAEPRFNYFLSSINKTSEVNYKPYRIGIYTGIYYEF